MATLTELEQRLATLETEVAELKKRLPPQPANANWLDQVIGSITNQEAFAEVLAYGRAFREEEVAVHQPRGYSAEEVKAMLKIEKPAPDDATVEQWIEDRRLEKYGK